MDDIVLQCLFDEFAHYPSVSCLVIEKTTFKKLPEPVLREMICFKYGEKEIRFFHSLNSILFEITNSNLDSEFYDLMFFDIADPKFAKNTVTEIIQRLAKHCN